ncbi:MULTISPECIES: hypothetical protein [Tolypothrix]|uniref:Uncharacterized protein n=2 Tax=Tolypothrix TaxID=111782 RepID=A0A0C1R281_9CYAN
MPRPKKQREEVQTTFRVDPVVKRAIEQTAEIATRSVNNHIEYLLKLGLLAFAGIDPNSLSQAQIAAKFEEIYGDKENKS